MRSAHSLILIFAALVAENVVLAFTVSQYIAVNDLCITFPDENWDKDTSTNFDGQNLKLAACQASSKAQAWTVNAEYKGNSGIINIWGGDWTIGNAALNSDGTPGLVNVSQPIADGTAYQYYWTDNSHLQDPSGKYCLTAINGLNLMAAQCDAYDGNQIWNIRNQPNVTVAGSSIPLGQNDTASESPKARRIHPFADRWDLCLTSQPDTQNASNANIGIQYCDTTDVSPQLMLFDFSETSSGGTTISYLYNDVISMCLVAFSNYNGTMIQARPCDSVQSATWNFVNDTIQWGQDPTMCMDVQEGSDGTSYDKQKFLQLDQLWECTPGDRQQFWAYLSLAFVSKNPPSNNYPSISSNSDNLSRSATSSSSASSTGASSTGSPSSTGASSTGSPSSTGASSTGSPSSTGTSSTGASPTNSPARRALSTNNPAISRRMMKEMSGSVGKGRLD